MPKYASIVDVQFKPVQKGTLLSEVIGGWTHSNSVASKTDELAKHTFIGLGQAGGRAVVPAYHLGFPTYFLNSSYSDFKELKQQGVNDKNMIFTGMYDVEGKLIENLQGTSRDRNLGLTIASANQNIYTDLSESAEVLGADFVWVTSSLSGGTGSGAIYAVAEKIIEARQNYHLDTTGAVYPNSVGLIIILPSETDSGASYRANALEALKELQDFINAAEEDNKNGLESLGAIYVIDNEHFENSQVLKDFRQNDVKNHQISAHTLSNNYAIASIYELLTFLTLPAEMSLDRTEVARLLGTTGFINFKKILNDAEVMEKLNKLNGETSGDSLKEMETIVSDFAQNLVKKEDILMDMSELTSIPLAYSLTIVNDNFNIDYAKAINKHVTDKLGAVDANAGVFKMSSQDGVTTFLAYVSDEFPIKQTKRIKKSLDDLNERVAEQEKVKEQQLESLKSDVFGDNTKRPARPRGFAVATNEQLSATQPARQSRFNSVQQQQRSALNNRQTSAFNNPNLPQRSQTSAFGNNNEAPGITAVRKPSSFADRNNNNN